MLTARAVDVLPRVDLTQDVVAGDWQQQAAALLLQPRSTKKLNPRVALPLVCSGSYLIEVEFTAATVLGDMVLHLPYARGTGGG